MQNQQRSRTAPFCWWPTWTIHKSSNSSWFTTLQHHPIVVGTLNRFRAWNVDEACQVRAPFHLPTKWLWENHVKPMQFYHDVQPNFDHCSYQVGQATKTRSKEQAAQPTGPLQWAFLVLGPMRLRAEIHQFMAGWLPPSKWVTKIEDSCSVKHRKKR